MHTHSLSPEEMGPQMDNPRLVEDKAGGDRPGPRICVTLLPNQLLSDPGVGVGRGGAGLPAEVGLRFDPEPAVPGQQGPPRRTGIPGKTVQCGVGGRSFRPCSVLSEGPRFSGLEY